MLKINIYSTNHHKISENKAKYIAQTIDNLYKVL